ncbi:hypothetical protein PMI12_01136 [Variovorax sp. CF313]|nr:hypothetical protein PMI12_01136 [Variovorax sp. CF313]
MVRGFFVRASFLGGSNGRARALPVSARMSRSVNPFDLPLSFDSRCWLLQIDILGGPWPMLQTPAASARLIVLPPNSNPSNWYKPSGSPLPTKPGRIPQRRTRRRARCTHAGPTARLGRRPPRCRLVRRRPCTALRHMPAQRAAAVSLGVAGPASCSHRKPVRGADAGGYPARRLTACAPSMRRAESRPRVGGIDHDDSVLCPDA